MVKHPEQLSFEGHAERQAQAAPDPNEGKIYRECWQCSGHGKIAGCFEDCCVCDAEDDPDGCCAPSRCDNCKGKGGYYVDPQYLHPDDL